MHDIKWKLKIWTATQKENKTIIWKIATTTKQKFLINIIILFCNFYLDNSVGFYILSMYHVLSVLIFAVSRGITLIRIILWLFTYFLCTVLSVLIIDLSRGFSLAIISFMVLLGEHKSSWLWSEMWQKGGLPIPWMWLVNVFANGFYSVKLFPVCEYLLQLNG